MNSFEYFLKYIILLILFVLIFYLLSYNYKDYITEKFDSTNDNVLEYGNNIYKEPDNPIDPFYHYYYKKNDNSMENQYKDITIKFKKNNNIFKEITYKVTVINLEGDYMELPKGNYHDTCYNMFTYDDKILKILSGTGIKDKYPIEFNERYNIYENRRNLNTNKEIEDQIIEQPTSDASKTMVSSNNGPNPTIESFKSDEYKSLCINLKNIISNNFSSDPNFSLKSEYAYIDIFYDKFLRNHVIVNTKFTIENTMNKEFDKVKYQSTFYFINDIKFTENNKKLETKLIKPKLLSNMKGEYQIYKFMLKQDNTKIRAFTKQNNIYSEYNTPTENINNLLIYMKNENKTIEDLTDNINSNIFNLKDKPIYYWFKKIGEMFINDVTEIHNKNKLIKSTTSKEGFENMENSCSDRKISDGSIYVDNIISKEYGFKCEDYKNMGLCNNGKITDKYIKVVNNIDTLEAKDACCVCGGGIKLTKKGKNNNSKFSKPTENAEVYKFNKNKLKRYEKEEILKLKGKLFKNYKITSEICNQRPSPTPTPSISPSPSTDINCTYNTELQNLNPCLNEHCKTFNLNGNQYNLVYENRPLEKLSPFTKKHFGTIKNKKIHKISINNINEVQNGEDVIIPSKMGDKYISELGHCLDNCCNQIIGSKTGNVWDRKRSVFDKKICKEKYKRKIKPEVNSDIFNYLLGGNINDNSTIFEYKKKNSHIKTF